MDWWNKIVEWLGSDEGWRIISTAVIPFVAIIVAAIVAALIGRGITKRVISMTEQERRTATIAALISGARRASKWNTLSVPEQQHAEHLLHDADTRLRLLPLNGSGMVADWAAHELNEMKRNSVSFSFQAEQSLIEFRNRLVEWQARPGRAKKLFKADLDQWAYEAGQADQDLVRQQKEWAQRQVEESSAAVTPATAPAVAPAASTPPVAMPAAAASAAAPAPASPAPGDAPEPFQYSLPESVAKRDADAPVEDWTRPAVDGPAETSESPAETSATAVPAEVDDEGNDPTPGPVSAGSVRQRIVPEERDY